MSVSHIKASLARSLGSKRDVIEILKAYTGSDHVDLLWYDEGEDAFVNRINHEKIPLKFLADDIDSMLGEAYQKGTPYCSTHLQYETHYNVAIDNPFKLNLSAQLILPLVQQGQTVGIIRFAKQQFTFPQTALQNLLQIESALLDIFSTEMDDQIARLNESFFSVDADRVYRRLSAIREECALLSAETHHPEVLKLIRAMQENVNEVCDYIRFNADEVTTDAPVSSHNHVLIADDVHMNVKILHAMLKEEADLTFSLAYDGEEALKKVETAYKKRTPVDVLFLDHYMPGKLGLDVAKAIREFEKHTSDHTMTIVSITNDPRAIEPHKSLFDYHLSKPFSKAAISDVIRKAIAR